VVPGTSGVYIATHDIAAGTPGIDVVHALKLVRVPPAAVVSDAVPNPAALAGQITLDPIYRGEQLTLRHFARAGGVVAHLSGSMRAIQVAGDPNQLLAGTLHAGDHVDVVASFKAGTSQRPYGGTVLRNVLVLQAPKASTSSVGGSSGYSAMLRLTDAQAQTFFFITKNGDWSLVLRPVAHAADSASFVDSIQSVLKEGR
jgi:Flp pilus assembly protein CpaB